MVEQSVMCCHTVAFSSIGESVTPCLPDTPCEDLFQKSHVATVPSACPTPLAPWTLLRRRFRPPRERRLRGHDGLPDFSRWGREVSCDRLSKRLRLRSVFVWLRRLLTFFRSRRERFGVHRLPFDGFHQPAVLALPLYLRTAVGELEVRDPVLETTEMQREYLTLAL